MPAYLLRQVGAITQMNPLQTTLAGGIFSHNQLTIVVPTHSRSAVGVREGYDTDIRDIGTLDKPDPLQLGKSSKPRDRIVG